jgi:hypothetical protein
VLTFWRKEVLLPVIDAKSTLWGAAGKKADNHGKRMRCVMFSLVSLIFHLFLWNDKFYWVRWFNPFTTVKIRMFAAIHDRLMGGILTSLKTFPR